MIFISSIILIQHFFKKKETNKKTSLPLCSAYTKVAPFAVSTSLTGGFSEFL